MGNHVIKHGVLRARPGAVSILHEDTAYKAGGASCPTRPRHYMVAPIWSGGRLRVGLGKYWVCNHLFSWPFSSYLSMPGSRIAK